MSSTAARLHSGGEKSFGKRWHSMSSDLLKDALYLHRYEFSGGYLYVYQRSLREALER